MKFCTTVCGLLVIVALAQGYTGVRNSDGNLHLACPTGNHITAMVGTTEIHLDEIPSVSLAQANASGEAVRSALLSVTDGLRIDTNQLRSDTAANVSRVDTARRNLEDVFNIVANTTIPGMELNIRDVNASVNSAHDLNTQQGVTISELLNTTQQTNAQLTMAKSAIEEAATCAATGQHYNYSTRSCTGGETPLLGAPDWESEWFWMQSNSGSADTTFKEIVHGLGSADLDVVKVVAMYVGGNARLTGSVLEGLGSQTCDDDNTNGCNDYGGFVYGYDATRLRMWLPEQNNGPLNGRTFMLQDGWGGGLMNMQSNGPANDPIFFKAFIWRSYRRGFQPDYNTSLLMRTNVAAQSRAERSYNFNELPERVYVTVTALGGNNRGFVFPARGASIADDDGGKQYGGLVFAYNENTTRLWAPSSSNGRIISIEDGWGGERNIARETTGMVTIKAWRQRTPPHYASEWSYMCSNCNGSCTPLNLNLAYRRVRHGFGTIPARVQVQSRYVNAWDSVAMYASTGNFNAMKGYIFEGVGGGNDDEHNQRTGIQFVYDKEFVSLYAPVRSNGQSAALFTKQKVNNSTLEPSHPGLVGVDLDLPHKHLFERAMVAFTTAANERHPIWSYQCLHGGVVWNTGRLLGVVDGWGSGVWNVGIQCAHTRVLAWKN